MGGDSKVALDAKTGFSGLVTSVGEVTADAGMLRVADNVTLRRMGALSLRPLFSTAVALSRTYKAAFNYKGTYYYVDSTGNYWKSNSTQLLTPGGTTVTPVRSDVQGAHEARGNFYFTATEGVYKVTGTSDTALTRTGLSPTACYLDITVAAYGGTELLTANQQVAYRAVAVWTDPNGVILRSRPTGAVIAQSGATAATPFVSVGWDGVPSGYTGKVEVYRTRIFPSTVTPDEEFQLVKTWELPVGVTTTYGAQDRVLDIQRGQTLYTSPSQGGIEAANDRPPGAACIERYRTCLFFGNTVGPQRYIVSYTPSTANLAGVATGIGVRMTTVNTTNGSPNISVTGSVTGIQAGMMASLPGFSAYATVIGVAGSTVTVNINATSTTSGQNARFYDSVTINGSYIGLGVGPGGSTGGLASPITTSSFFMNQGNPLSFSYTVYEQTPPVAGYTQTVVIERIDRGGAAFQVRASHGNEMSPVLPLGNAAQALSSTNDVFPHGLMWSEPDEPEHVPLKNFARVGDAGKAILALVATRDRLLIFKEDGLYALTGDVAANFAIYPLDTTCLCILPGSVRRLKNTVYLLTNLGLVAVDENGGVTVISRAIQTELSPIITSIRATWRSTTQYLMPGLAGVTATSDDANNEYWLALGTTTPSFGGQVLVYNADADGFTTYSFTSTPTALAQDPDGQPLVLTSSAQLAPSTSLGAITARISPHGFVGQALSGKLWTHIAVAFSRLTGTTSCTLNFSGSESQVAGTTVSEQIPMPALSGLIELPLGSLHRHPLPRSMARAFLSFVELVVVVSNGFFVLELFGTESRENIPNKQPSHGSGAT